MSKDLALSFESPRAGWLPLHIKSGDAKVTLDISYTPNDFLEELVTAALGALESEGTFSAYVYEEPEEKTILLTRLEETVTVNVQRNRGAELLFAFTGPTAGVILPLWRALRRLQTDPQFFEWGREFPSSVMNQLTEEVQRLKAPAE